MLYNGWDMSSGNVAMTARRAWRLDHAAQSPASAVWSEAPCGKSSEYCLRIQHAPRLLIVRERFMLMLMLTLTVIKLEAYSLSLYSYIASKSISSSE